MTGSGDAARSAGIRLLCAAAVVLSLAACASYRAQPLHPADSAHAFASRRLDAPALGAAVAPLLPEAPRSWPPPRWDRGTLLAVALVENPRLAQARARLAETVAHEITVAQPKNPSLGLEFERALSGARPWLYGVTFAIPLQWPPLRRLRIDEAKLMSSAARFRLLSTTWQVRRELIDALSDWQAARAQAAILDRLLNDEQRLLATLQRRIATGEEAPDAVVPLQAQLQADLQTLARARARKQRAKDRAAAALGMPPQALDRQSLEWADWGRPPPVRHERERREQALLSRSDLAAAISEYQIAENHLRRAIVRQYPRFALEPDFPLTPGFIWDHGVRKISLGVSLTLPIFNQNQGEIAEARAARVAAGQRVLAVQARIYGEIVTAERQEALAREQLSAAQRRYELILQQSTRAELALRLGAADAVQALTARVTEYRAQLAQVQAQAGLQEARNALEDALRTPLSGPELQLARAVFVGGKR